MSEARDAALAALRTAEADLERELAAEKAGVGTTADEPVAAPVAVAEAAVKHSSDILLGPTDHA